MRFRLFVLALLLGTSNAAWAKDVKLPKEKPALMVTLPDEWSPKPTENGYEATSPDGAVFVSFEAGEPKTVKDLISKSIKALAAKGVEIDPDSQKKTEGLINGMKAVNVDFAGKYKGADTSVILIVLLPSEDKAVVATFWGSEQGQTANGAALGAIQQSLKPAS